MTAKKDQKIDPNIDEMAATLAGRWADYICDARSGAISKDINTLIQQVLRESYLENTKDLQFYADKLRFFNKLKKKIREEMARARRALRSHFDSEGCGHADDPVEPYVPLSFETYPTLDEECKPRVVARAGDSLNTQGELEDYIDGLEQQLAMVGDDAQLANIDLQNALQKSQQSLQTMSNVSKMLHDTAMAVIRKIG